VSSESNAALHTEFISYSHSEKGLARTTVKTYERSYGSSFKAATSPRQKQAGR